MAGKNLAQAIKGWGQTLLSRFKALPRKVQIAIPIAFFALFIWPTPYAHDDEIVGLKSSYGITPMFNEEMTRDCIDENGCSHVYARTRKLRLLGDKQYETWTYPGDSSRWFGNRLTYSADGGFRAIEGMVVTDDAIGFAPGASSRMMRIQGERSATPPQLIKQEWFTLEEGDEVTEVASGKALEVAQDAPQVTLVLQTRNAAEAQQLYDLGLYLADVDDGVIYWQFEEDPIARVEREEVGTRSMEEVERQMRERLNPSPVRSEPVEVTLTAPLQDGALSKMRSGQLSLMQGQRGWVIPLQPTEAAD